MKKKRGLRRYYRNLDKSFIPENLSFKGGNAWFDFYHFHIDNTGLGNRSWKSRVQHLDALFLIAEKIKTKLDDFEKPFQYWIEIYENDSWDDAVYIHTENPNQSTFPASLTFDSDIKITNTNLKDYIQSKNYVIKTKNLLEDGKPIIGYFLQKKDFGLTLEK
jgi:hypothetical protein